MEIKYVVTKLQQTLLCIGADANIVISFIVIFIVIVMVLMGFNLSI